MDTFWKKINEQIVHHFKINGMGIDSKSGRAVTYDTVFDHICNILSTKTQLEVDILLEKYP